MQLGLTVIALTPAGRAPVLCYGQLRQIRRDDRFPSPSLPRDANKLRLGRLAPDRFGAKLVSWDQPIEERDVPHIMAELQAGRLNVPKEAPEIGGLSIAGVATEDTWVAEGFIRAPIDGAGVLRSTALIVPDGAAKVVQALQDVCGKPDVARELQLLIEAVDERVGLQQGVFGRGRLGAVEYLWRAGAPGCSAPLAITTIKPDLASNDPCRTVVLKRPRGAEPRSLRIQLRVSAWDEVILDKLIWLDAEQPELSVDVGRHLTRIAARIYDGETGDLLDELDLSFTQSIGINLSLQTAVDLLPAPFRAAPAAPDLTERPRFTGSQFEIGPGAERDLAASAIRANTHALEAVLGPKAWRARSRFFHTGAEPQLDVIRWMKGQFERGDVAESFLIDPYLGSQAFERVILRHGNEDIKLTVVVSPARVDPDADEMDAATQAGSHLQTLINTAEALKDQVCGELTLVHVQRGQGARQAFHDRYLGLVLKSGRPEVHLLSNSLSKAAGDWPFIVAEVEPATAWEISSYVARLTSVGGTDLDANVVWQSEKAGGGPPTPRAGLLPPFWQPYLQLSLLDQSDRLEDEEAVAPILAEITEALPQTASAEEQAALIVENMHGRGHFSARLARAVRGKPGHIPLAEALEDAVLQLALDGISPVKGEPPQLTPELAVLRAAGQRLVTRFKGTDLLRNAINPVGNDYAVDLELGRGGGKSIAVLLAGLAVAVIGLETAHTGIDLPPKVRSGIAVDYINLLARLLRSSEAEAWFTETPHSIPRLPVAVHAIQTAIQLGDTLGDEVSDAIVRLRADPLASRVLSAIEAARLAALPLYLRRNDLALSDHIKVNGPDSRC